MLNIDEIENRVLEMVSAGEGDPFQDLRLQISLIQERHRAFSGKGLVTRFSVKDDAKALQESKSFYIGDVSGQTSALEHGFGSILFVDRGFIDRLEVFTYGETWPDHLPDLTLKYDGTGTRQGLAGRR